MFLLNKKEVEFGMFPNSEIFLPVKDLKSNSYNRIIWEWSDNNDFVKLGLLKEELDSRFTNSELHIKYFPYSRMDRYNDEYVFSLKFATKFINALDFFVVKIREPHSDVVMALVDKSIKEDWCKFKIRDVIKKYDIDSLFYPDAGAQKRYTFDFPVAVGNKVRDFASGNILSYTATGIIGNNVLIVDDLCSRGGTFVEASIKLKELGAKKVFLLVSYLEENVKTGILDQHIEKVFAGNDVKGYKILEVLED